MMNWRVSCEQVPGGFRFTHRWDDDPLSFAEALDALRGDAAFRARLNALLAAVPCAAYRWETPGLTAATAGRPFEYVALDAPYLAGDPDPEAFAEHFGRAAGAEAVAFPNLGGDATLVAPCPVAAPGAYGHLAAFVREAQAGQRDAFWRLVGETTFGRLGAKPVWLSTAGAGVPWLHARLDDRPKYYGYGPYRAAPASESA